MNYIKPSLERHVGCDLIDLYPGVGLWSQKLRDLLQPRSHLLLEPNADIYEPFLKPLLSNPNTRLVPLSGIVWKDLNSVLTPEYLPHQVVRDARDSSASERNDTLLVVGNIAFFPKRKWNEYSSLSNLLLFQFIRSLRTSAIFQKYGLVRMLLWVDDEDKAPLLPRSIQKRRRLAVEAELSTDWITEVAGADSDAGEGRYRRWRSIDIESAQKVAERMREAGKTIPSGRESKLVREIRQTGGEMEAGRTALRFYKESANLEHQFTSGEFSKKEPQYLRLKRLRYRAAQEGAIAKLTVEMMEEHHKLIEMMRQEYKQQGSESWQNPSDETKAAMEAYFAKIRGMSQLNLSKFQMARDNLHVFHQDTPVLLWDRRDMEPLLTKPEEFFPNNPACLLDIQPKAAHPLLRNLEYGTTFDILLPKLLMGAPPLHKLFDGFSPGAGEGVLEQCPSLRDPDLNGVPLPGLGEIWPRAMNERQFMECLEAWKKWPFAPSYRQLLSHVTDYGDRTLDDEVENKGKMLGSYDLG